MKNILLVNPKYRLEIRWISSKKEIDVKADYFPLGLGTVAALTPEGCHVDIWDELVRGEVEKADLDKKYDLVGVTSHSANLGRANEIGAYFKQKGILTAIGGPGVTSNSHRCRKGFDILFIGEAELTWPRFVREWQSGSYKPEYRQIDKPDILSSPAPDWRSIESDVDKYAMGTVQTTRGCPIDCEFCDVIYLHGRRQRYKSIDQILKEVRALEQLGVESISFNDDNFTIAHKRAKDVLRALITLNNSFSKPLRFMTQLGIDISRDEEMLELLADVNMYEVLIGIESPNKDSLREAGKFNNLKGDLVAEVRKVLSYGIAVRGAMIIGFDHDDQDIFEQQYQFIQETCLPSISMHMLNAPVGTRLWRRLHAEGRVIDAFAIADKSTQRLFNNIIPKRMSRVELMEGFADLYEKLFSWESFKERMFGFVSLVNRPPKILREEESLQELLALGPDMNLDKESCGALAEIFEFTDKTAPFLLGRVRELAIQFVRYRHSAYDFIPGLRQQIELESSGKLQIKLDDRPIPIPDGFRQEFDAIFPSVQQRAVRNLIDKSKVPEVLVDVFVDFLIHEEGFSKLEDYHITYLNEIVDSACTRVNGQAPAGAVPAETADNGGGDENSKRLKDDVLIGVEHELMKMQLAQQAV